MKVSDYIIEFLISKRVKDIFGYPGGVICHVMDSVTKYQESIKAHTLYHEQACAFAACSYAQATHNLGVAFATSGPGATNLLTGITNAYYDSIPVLFLTGNVDTYGVKGDMNIRQRGFQETDIVSIVHSITKYSVFVSSPQDIRYCLEKAWHYATSGRPGPVLLDLPADVQRAEINSDELRPFEIEKKKTFSDSEGSIHDLLTILKTSKRPCILAGSAVKQSGNVKLVRQVCEKLNIPLVTSMPAINILAYDHRLNGGCIGTNGHRYANFIVAKADLLITIGARLDLKQVGNKRTNFAPNAKIYRIDIDEGELAYKVRDDETSIHMDLSNFLKIFKKRSKGIILNTTPWIAICGRLKDTLKDIDTNEYHNFIIEFSTRLKNKMNITIDTGQSAIWVPQAFVFKDAQQFFMSAGLGSMGYSLPAAIGAYYANKLPVVCFNGDAGFQMNIQELEFIAKEHLPITVVLLNNCSMGMIRQFQEKNFNKNYYLTTIDSGYAVPDFKKIANAYGFKYKKVTSGKDMETYSFSLRKPSIIDVQFDSTTYLQPNFGPGPSLEDMAPPIDRDLYSELIGL